MCLSPALDVTYRVDQLRPGATNRVAAVARRPGGKAVNVARVLHGLGEPVRLLAPIGGAAGEEFAGEVAALGLPAEFVRGDAPTRSTATVVDDDGAATVFVEPAVIDCWDSLLVRAKEAISTADAVVISGRVPTGAPQGALGELVRRASGAGRPIVVDTSGPPLIDALRAGTTIAKPNADELAEITGGSDAQRAARSLAARYGTTIVASLGADGVFVAGPAGEWRARPMAELRGNPTGAGDALVAGLARGLRTGAPMADVLPDAVALAAAAVLSPYAGEVDPARFAEQRTGVVVEKSEVPA
ncbi:MAG TPA: hexose kinase [Jatrophihabitans sp.]|nr:hexose kinase [Jatrophihabitans sp.]